MSWFLGLFEHNIPYFVFWTIWGAVLGLLFSAGVQVIATRLDQQTRILKIIAGMKLIQDLDELDEDDQS